MYPVESRDTLVTVYFHEGVHHSLVLLPWRVCIVLQHQPGLYHPDWVGEAKRQHAWKHGTGDLHTNIYLFTPRQCSVWDLTGFLHVKETNRNICIIIMHLKMQAGVDIVFLFILVKLKSVHFLLGSDSIVLHWYCYIVALTVVSSSIFFSDELKNAACFTS